MNQGENTVSTAQTSHSPSFQTPDRPSEARRSTSIANAAKGQSWCDPPASSSFSVRSSKRNYVPSTLDQTTLTQIDFVTPTPPPARSDESLQYLNEKRPQRGRQAHHEVIELDDDSNNDDEYRPPSSRQPRRARGVRFEQEPRSTSTGHSKSSHPREVDSKSKRRKSGGGVKGNKLDKDAKKGNKTLTQMDYVRRYLKIEPDDEVKLEYTYTTPKKNDRKQANRHAAGNLAPQSDHFSGQEASSGGKKRKLSIAADTKVKLENEKENYPLGPGSVTPRAKREREIPSSQSPESSGIAFITSSQFRTATHSPYKRDAADTAGQCIKQESPLLQRIKEASHCPPSEIPESNESQFAALVPDSPLPHNSASDQGSIALLSEQLKSEEVIEHHHRISEHVPNTQRTVVYETDAETDYGDLEDDLPNPIESPRQRKVPHHDPGAANLEHEDATEESSQALPPMAPPAMEEESEQLHQDDNPTSDASSIYYHRIQPATQFPLGPVPNLNTQRLAELFPDERNDESIATMSFTEPSSKTPKRMTVASETQSFDPETRLDSDQTLTELVPESSPIVRQDSGSTNFRTPARRLASRDIVQVESSQPADRHRNRSQNQDDSGPRSLIKRSDLLTSSVMESIPLPVFLMDSQDTVGEPYSSPKET